ncbi:Cytochrome P450 [Sergentomyia squamirostris]
MIETVLYIVGGILIAGYVYMTWHFDHWKKRSIPGPAPKFLLGNLPSAVTQKRQITYEIDDLYREFKDRYGMIGYLNIRSPTIMILQPDIARDVLIKNFKSFSDNQFADIIDKDVDPMFGRNPFMLKGNEWKEKRAEITPAFTTNRIKTMYPIVDDVCANMKSYLEREIAKKPVNGFDAKEIAAMFTTDVVSSCIFGVDGGSFTGGDPIIRSMGKKLFDPNWKLIAYFIVIQLFPLLTKLYRMPFVPKDVEKFFVNLMKDAIAFRKKTNVDRFDYLHYLLELKEKKNLNELDMMAHAVTFFLDGFETSSIALSFALYNLASNKNAQDTLRAEIKETLAKHGKLTHDVVVDMPYLDQVFHENLRLNPPATFMGKVCTENCELKVSEGEYRTVKKGDDVIIPLYSYQRDPKYYDQPDEFIPERFNPENGGSKAFRDRGVFIPFGEGPRICLGMKFAQAQVKAALVSLVNNFNISVNSKTQEPIVLDPKQFLAYATGGIWLDFEAI